MKKQTFAAVATLATTMFVSQGAFAQDEAGQSSTTERQRASQQEQSGASAQQAGSQQEGQQAGARAGQSRQAGQSQNKDQKFVEFASTNDQFEIQAAKLAEQKSQDEQIKQMAKQIAQDHQQCSQKLQQAAQQAGVQVSQQLKPWQQAKLQEMQQLQGEDFDKAWLYGQVGGHTVAVLKFRDASQNLQNEQLKQFAQQTLPKLQQHLQHANQMADFDSAQTAGATERGSGARDRSGPRSGTDTTDPAGTGSLRSGEGTAGDRSGTSPRPGAGSSPGKSSGGSTDTSGTDTTNPRGAGTNDPGSGSSTDAGSSGRSPAR